MKPNYFQRVHNLTPTRLWINNVTREQAKLAIEAGAVGCTHNPTYVWKMLQETVERSYVLSLLDGFVEEFTDDRSVLLHLQRALIKDVAEIFLPLYEASGGQEGFVCIQGDPFTEDEQTILELSRFHSKASPNIMAKIPVTEKGLCAIAILIREGVPITATECMALRQVVDVCEVYETAKMENTAPAPLYFALITGIYDEYIQTTATKQGIIIDRDVLWHAGLSIAKKVHALLEERKYNCGFLIGGARGLHHFTEMVGGNVSVTINWENAADQLLALDGVVTSRFLQPVPASMIDELAEKLEDHRKAYFQNGIKPDEYECFGPVSYFREIFESAWTKSLKYIARYREKRTLEE